MIVINVVIGRFSGEDLKWLAHVTIRLQATVWLQLCRLIRAKYSSLCTNHSWGIVIVMFSNSNWTEWSTIQWVIVRVISKSNKCKARGRFEITSTITPWIVRQEVASMTNFGIKNVSWELLWAKTSVPLFLSFKNYRKHCEGSH